MPVPRTVQAGLPFPVLDSVPVTVPVPVPVPMGHDDPEHNSESIPMPVVPEHDPEDGFQKRKSRKRDGSTLRKAPQAPKRFKSSYICFFMAKQPEIKEALGEKASVTEVSKRSAEMWRGLPAEERAHWDEVAAKDKQRYMVEKASYTGPWQVPWKRAKKVSETHNWKEAKRCHLNDACLRVLGIFEAEFHISEFRSLNHSLGRSDAPNPPCLLLSSFPSCPSL